MKMRVLEEYNKDKALKIEFQIALNGGPYRVETNNFLHKADLNDARNKWKEVIKNG